jgi:hypothetical protein
MVAVAIVDFQTVEVTPVVRATGILTGDLAEYNGRLYSNKAPGGALLVVPVYAVARAIFGPPSGETLRPTLNVIRIFGASIPTLLFGLWFAWVARRSGCSATRTGLAVTLLLFATPLLTYGLLFFTHPLSCLTIFGAWSLLFVSRRSPGADAGAGALIGMAVLSESVAIFPAAALIACALPRLRIGGTVRLILGGVPFATALLVYNKLSFDAWIAVPAQVYDNDPYVRALHRTGWYGIHWPTPDLFLGLLFDSSKGLLILSPILLIALAGLGAARRALTLPALIALLVVSAAILLPMAGYSFWSGGRGVGARYILPMVPFLALLIALAKETVIEAVLLGASTATVAVMSLVFPFIPTTYAVPWVSFSLPLLANGCVIPNIFHLVWRPLALAVPFVIVAIAVGLTVPRSRIALLVLGALLWFGIGWIAEARKPSAPFQRVLAEEVHFEHEGAIARAFPPGHPVTVTLQQRAEALKRFPPPSWPF